MMLNPLRRSQMPILINIFGTKQTKEGYFHLGLNQLTLNHHLYSFTNGAKVIMDPTDHRGFILSEYLILIEVFLLKEFVC